MCSYVSILCSLCVSGVVFFMWTQLGILVQLQDEVRASQLAQASERVGSLIPASQQG